MKKIICISLLILLSLYRLNAQKKGVPKKITFDNLADATLTDSREGMIVPVDSLDVGIHNFSLGHKLLNSFNSTFDGYHLDFLLKARNAGEHSHSYYSQMARHQLAGAFLGFHRLKERQR